MLTYLKEIIKTRKAISIYDFINIALYDPRYGYYFNNNIIGKNNDYITASEISQIFGDTIALWIVHAWETIGCPQNFALVELGPGKATMLQDIMRITKNLTNFHNALQVHLLEISPILEDIQRENLYDLCKTTWHKTLCTLPEIPTIFITNEFFDSLPIRQFLYKNKQYHEICIGLKDEEFITVTQFVQDCIHISHPEESIIETCPLGEIIIDKIAQHIHKNNGAALIIDYGYLDKPYISTIQSVKNHCYNDILHNIGQADISAHVDFTILRRRARRYTYVSEIISQKDFLENFGIQKRAERLMQNALLAQKHALFSALYRLTARSAMGELFKCMMIWKESCS